MFIGFPVSEFLMENGKKEEWVSERLLSDYKTLGYSYKGEKRMGYAVPKWVQGRVKPMILLLDDFNRGALGTIQAVMEVTDRQEYVSWKLPAGSTVILSNNPDNQEYFVTTQDDAQKTRYLNFHMKFDTDCWALWAEGAKIDSRC